MNDREMIAAPLCDILEPFISKMESAFCECLRDFAQSSGAMPCVSYPFRYTGSLGQSVNTFTMVNVFQVPPGQVGTITRIALGERTPGALYGAAFTLIVNDTFHPAFSRVDHTVGAGLESGMGTRICLEEQDTISILVECWWTPIVFTGIASTYIQQLWPFEISGFFEPKVLAA